MKKEISVALVAVGAFALTALTCKMIIDEQRFRKIKKIADKCIDTNDFILDELNFILDNLAYTEKLNKALYDILDVSDEKNAEKLREVCVPKTGNEI